MKRKLENIDMYNVLDLHIDVEISHITLRSSSKFNRKVLTERPHVQM